MVRVRPDEDWTTPLLKTTHLTPEPPVVAEKTDGATFTREMVALQWRPFDPIYLYIIKPKGVAKPPPVLFLYGYPTTTKRFLNATYCRRVTEGGCAAIGFDTALTGERFRMRPMREWFVSELPESLATSAHDVQLILDYLVTRGDLDMGHVGIFGQGSGGAIAVLAAAADPRIKVIDLLSPWGDWPEWAAKTALLKPADRPGYTRPDFLKRVAPLDPVAWLSRLKGRPLRLQSREDDPAVPLDCQRSLQKAVPPGAVLVTYKDVMALYGGTSGSLLFSWMAGQLKPPAASLNTPPRGASAASGAKTFL